jgi:hypothetical protein
VLNLVLFGDSHAIQWFNPLQRIAESHGWRLTTIVKSGCPATDISPPGVSSFSENCTKWRKEAIRQIAALRPSIVFVGSATTYLRQNGKPASTLRVTRQEWQDGTRRTLKALTDAGLHVVSIRDTPISPFDIPTCLARSVRRWIPGGSCEMDKSKSLDESVFETEKISARGLPNVRFLDLTDQMCDKTACWAVKKDMIMYRDDNHLTGSFAESLAPILAAGLPPLNTSW